MSTISVWTNSLRLASRHPLARAGSRATVISSALAFLVAVMFWWPAIHQRDKAAGEVDAKRKLAITAMQAKEIGQAYTVAMSQLDTFERKLHGDNVQSRLVAGLSRLAGAHQIKIVSETFTRGREQHGYAPLNLELRLQGSYAGLRSFFAGLQALPTWTYVEQGDISADPRGGGLSARLKLVTFRRAGA